MIKEYCLMKKITILSVAVLGILAAVSCTRETAAPELGRTVLTASLPSTRTALGEKDGASWPNYWKSGDQISVNGIASDPLGAEADGQSSADFTFEGLLQTPLYAVYPASAVFKYTTEKATVSLPKKQNYVEGSYDPAAFLMCGTSADAGTVELSPMMSVFHLSLTGTGSISKVKLTGAAETVLSGVFIITFNGLFSPLAISNEVEMEAEAPVELPAEFFICVPASLEGALTVEVFDIDGGIMAKNATIKSPLAPGQVYSPAPLEYTPSFDITIAAEGITSSTAVICWEGSPEKPYTIGVYSDSHCTELLDSYSVDAGNACWGGNAPRFCISGLDSGSTYYVRVVETDQDIFSNILPVSTEEFEIVQVSSTPAEEGDVILAEDFGELRWDCDMIGGGVGWFPTTEAQTTSFGTVDVASYQAVATSNEKQLSPQTAAVAGSRLANWAQGAQKNMYIHPGYIKLVGNKNVTHLVTPALDNIPEGLAATLEVEITASAYYSESSSSFCTTNAIVAVQTEELDELADDATNTLDLSSNIASITLAEEIAWHTYKVTLNDVLKGNRLAFGADKSVSGNDARMNISDMKVTIKKLYEPGTRISLSVKDVSSSTAAVTWTYGVSAEEDIAKPYKASVYSDAECTNLVVSHAFEAEASCWGTKSPCFSFGGLAPSTTYWFVVEDTANGSVSDPVSATTEAFTPVDATTVTNAAVGDVILAEDFSEIGWGPDEFAGAAGFVPDPKVLGTPSGVSPEGLFTTSDNTGNRLFGTGIDLGDSRLSHGWGFFGNSSTYLRDAYLRVGASGGRTHIVTPALAGIPDGMFATIEVTVTATKYDSPIQLAVFAEKGLEVNSTTSTSSASYKKYTGASLEDGHAFDITTTKSFVTKSVTVSNVAPGSQLLIGSLENNDNKNRFYISDIVVKIVALVDDPTKKIHDDASFQEFVSAVAAGDKTLDARVTADVTLGASTVAAFETIEGYEGTLEGGNHTIAGLTKPLFNELKGTVKNLTLNSTLNITSDKTDIGILANIVSGTAEGCTSKGSVTFNVTGAVTGEHRIGGLIGKAVSSGASVIDCTNEASVTNETTKTDGETGELIIGGVLGTFWGSQFSISGCTNTGTVINKAYWDKAISVGGIIGQAGNNGDSSSDLNVADCTNSGAISNTGNSASSNNVGGVIGWIRFGTYSGNSNSGAISNSGDSPNNFVGGVFGYFDKNATFEDNSNTGDVTNSGAASSKNYVGGFLGRLGSSSTIKDNSNSGTVSNSGEASDNYIGGLIGYLYRTNTLMDNENSGLVSNSGDASASQNIGGIIGYLDKENKISDAGDSAKYKLTNSGDIQNSGSAKNIFIGGLFGRNSSGYFNMTGIKSVYSSNSGDITDTSGPDKSDGGDLCIGGLAGYTTTGIKTQYARNSGDITIHGDKGSTDVKVGGLGGWISNASFNFNNCRNSGDITIDCTTSHSIWAAGIVGCPKNNNTTHYYWYSNAVIDTHAATVGGENYTAGLMGIPEGDFSSSYTTFTMYGHKLAGTVWGNKTTTGLFCCTKNTAYYLKLQGGSDHPNTIAPGTVRRDDVNNDTVETIDDVTIGILVGGVGSSTDVVPDAISSSNIAVATW